MPDNLHVGLMGCGRIAQFFHLSILGKMPGVAFSALAEMDDTLRSQSQSAVPGANAYRDYRDLLADDGVDAVVICLPTGMHARAAIDSFEAGKHVYLEKPIGITLEEAAQVIKAESASGKTGMIGLNYRYHPLHQQLKQRINSGEIGNVIGVRSAFCGAKRELPGWKQKRATGGGVLLDLGTHHADLARFLFDDEIVGVCASVREMNYEGDFGSMQMELASGLVWHGMFSSQAVDTDTIEVIGDKGMLKLDRYAGTVERNESKPGAGLGKRGKRAVAGFQKLVKQTLNNAGQPSYQGALAAWANALSHSAQPPTPLVDGMHSLSVICAAERSAASGGVAVDPRDLVNEVNRTAMATYGAAG